MVLQSLYSYTQRDYLAMLQRLASPAIANKNIASYMNSLLMSAQESSAAAPTVANHNTKTVFRYTDVLGDPQSHSEAVIREFEAL